MKKEYKIELSLNEPQLQTIERIKKLAKSAHFINLQFRDNGEFKTEQADFLRKFLSNL